MLKFFIKWVLCSFLCFFLKGAIAQPLTEASNTVNRSFTVENSNFTSLKSLRQPLLPCPDKDIIIVPPRVEGSCGALVTKGTYTYEELSNIDCIKQDNGFFYQTITLTPIDTTKAEWEDKTAVLNSLQSFFDTLTNPCHFEYGNDEQAIVAYLWALRNNKFDADCMDGDKFIYIRPLGKVDDYKRSPNIIQEEFDNCVAYLVRRKSSSPCRVGNCYIVNRNDLYINPIDWIMRGKIQLNDVLTGFPNNLKVALIDPNGRNRAIRINRKNELSVKRFRNPDLWNKVSRNSMMGNLKLKVTYTNEGVKEAFYIPISNIRSKY